MLQTLPAMIGSNTCSGRVFFRRSSDAFGSPAKTAPFFPLRRRQCECWAHPDDFLRRHHPQYCYIVEVNGAGCTRSSITTMTGGWTHSSLEVVVWRAFRRAPPTASTTTTATALSPSVTAKARLTDAGWRLQGVCVGDYNNDGFEDLFLTYYGQNRLYRNNGDGTFADVTDKAGLH